jgi:hypothetical protein
MDDLWGSDDDDFLPSATSKKSDDGGDDVWGSDGDDEATERNAAAKRDEKNMRAKHYKVDAQSLSFTLIENLGLVFLSHKTNLFA